MIAIAARRSKAAGPWPLLVALALPTGLLAARASLSLLGLIATGALVLGAGVYFVQLPAGRLQSLLRPSRLALVVLATATILVPLTWSADLAEPWEELRGQESTAIKYGLAFLAAFALGIMSSSFRRGEAREGATPPSVVDARRILRRGVVVGTVGLSLFLALSGGPSAAISGLSSRREFFAGLGPLVALTFVPGMALVYCVQLGHPFSDTSTRRWGAVAAMLTLLVAWFTGQKSYVVLVILMLLLVGAAKRRIRRGLLILFVALLIPAATFYQYEIRQRASLGHSEGTIDTSSASSFVRTTWGPFSSSGLDQLRTLAAASRTAPLLRFRVDPLLAAPLTVIPRAAWPEKPEGAALRFSAEYFPDKLLSGTGIPPSLAAELVWEFGTIGAILALFLTGLAISRVERYLLTADAGTLRSALYPVFGASTFIAIKAGTDSGFRMFLLLGIAAVGVQLIHHRTSKDRGLA